MGVNVPAECSFIPTLTQEQESGGDRDCTQPTLLEIPTHRYDLRHQPKGGLPWPWKISPTISSSAGSKGSGLSPAPSLTCPRLWIHLSGAPSSSPTRRKGSSLDRRSVALRFPQRTQQSSAGPWRPSRCAAVRATGRHPPGCAASPGVTRVSRWLDSKRSRSAPGLRRRGLRTCRQRQDAGPRGNQYRPAVDGNRQLRPGIS